MRRFANWSCLAGVLWVVGTGLFGQDEPLAVELHDFDPIVCVKRFVLVNRSSGRVFGWAFRGVDVLADGEQVPDTQWRSSFPGGPLPDDWPWYYRKGAKSEWDRGSRRPGPLLPGERYGETCHCSGTRIEAPVDVRVEVLAVILEGGRGAGDPERVQQMLGDIDLARSAKKKLVPFLRQTLASSHGLAEAIIQERDKTWEYLKERDITALIQKGGYRPGYMQVRHDQMDNSFSIGLALLTALLSGLIPAFMAARTPVIEALNSAGRSQIETRISHRFLRQLLAASGIYGTLSYELLQRRREIGVRIAVGALGRNIFRFVVSRSVVWLCGGVIAGIALTAALSFVLRSLVYHVSPLDPLSLLIGLGLVLVVASLAFAVPTWRATKVDPMEALRCE